MGSKVPREAHARWKAPQHWTDRGGERAAPRSASPPSRPHGPFRVHLLPRVL